MKRKLLILLATAALVGSSGTALAKDSLNSNEGSGVIIATEALSPLQADAFQLKQLRNALEFIQHYHVAAREIDREMVITAYQRYLHRIDPNRTIFTQEETDTFLNEASENYQDVTNGNIDLAFHIFNLARQRFIDNVQYAIERLNSPFDFDSQRYWETKIEQDAPWPRADQISERNDRRLSNDYLSLKVIGTEPDAIVEKLSKRYKRMQSQWQKRNAEDVITAFSDSLTEIFDPHTAYLSPRGSEDFDINISLSLTGIGAVLQSDGDFTVIKKLINGGPAKESKKINSGDRIIGVAQGDGGDMIDVVGERLDDVVSQIRGKKGTTVRLQILERGATAAAKEIKLIRDVITLEDRIAKAETLEIDEGGPKVKVGVIEIPTFYTDFDAVRRGKKPENQTSTDVHKLIDQFKQQGVQALLIDLRGDGGGPLTEAINLTGLFIDNGPVVQTKGRPQEDREVYKDPLEGAAWDGPMAVLVDRNSASASEIFAGAIQDYQRGLILGETTFGKGTVQSLVPLAPIITKEPREKFGQVKLTTSKFYRVTGDSTQNKGVIPDIEIIMPFPSDVTGERSLDFALPFTQIERAKYAPYQMGISPQSIGVLQESHKQRTTQSEKFDWIRQTSDLFTSFINMEEIPLNELERRTEQQENDSKTLQLENMRRSILGEELLTEVEREDIDSVVFDDSDDEEESVVRADDFVLEEASYILADYYRLLESKVANY